MKVEEELEKQKIKVYQSFDSKTNHINPNVFDEILGTRYHGFIALDQANVERFIDVEYNNKIFHFTDKQFKLIFLLFELILDGTITPKQQNYLLKQPLFIEIEHNVYKLWRKETIGVAGKKKKIDVYNLKNKGEKKWN